MPRSKQPEAEPPIILEQGQPFDMHDITVQHVLTVYPYNNGAQEAGIYISLDRQGNLFIAVHRHDPAITVQVVDRGRAAQQEQASE